MKRTGPLPVSRGCHELVMSLLIDGYNRRKLCCWFDDIDWVNAMTVNKLEG